MSFGGEKRPETDCMCMRAFYESSFDLSVQVITVVSTQNMQIASLMSYVINVAEHQYTRAIAGYGGGRVTFHAGY